MRSATDTWMTRTWMTRGAALAAGLLLGLLPMAAPAAARTQADSPVLAEEGGSGWIVEEADNICGVRTARQITNPAKVHYRTLLDATPEIQEMKRKGLDKESPEGQLLYNAAVDRISRAAERVMSDRGYCSIWKRIRHRDGRVVPDVTEAVERELTKV